MTSRTWAAGFAVVCGVLLLGWWARRDGLPPQRSEPLDRIASTADGQGDAGDEASEGARPTTPHEADAAGEADPFRPRMMIVETRSQLPSGPLQDYIDERRQQAEAGDADAAYQLGLALKECRRIESSREALDARIRQVFQTRWFDGVPIDDPERMAGELKRRYARCEGVSEEARERYFEWMARAADLDSLEALESMNFQLPPGNICRERELEMCDGEQQAHTFALRERQAAWLQRAQSLGSANALWQLGAAYLNGEMMPPDSIEALAHLLAYQQVVTAFGIEDRVAGLVEALRDQLRPVERLQAEEKAQDLIENPRCCRYFR